VVAVVGDGEQLEDHRAQVAISIVVVTQEAQLLEVQAVEA
jgi:hypothetical protein